MQKRHTDRESYFGEQSQTSKNYYIPYIKEVIGHIPDKVLEVGCGEGGNLLPFAKAGCRVMGVDIDAMRIEQARTFFTQRHQQGQFISTDIFQLEDKATNFPLILLHDVIEHIRDKERFLSGLQKHLSADGAIFVGFPAWQMPFGGHQQIAHSRIVSHFPFSPPPSPHFIQMDIKTMRRAGTRNYGATGYKEHRMHHRTVQSHRPASQLSNH